MENISLRDLLHLPDRSFLSWPILSCNCKHEQRIESKWYLVIIGTSEYIVSNWGQISSQNCVLADFTTTLKRFTYAARSLWHFGRLLTVASLGKCARLLLLSLTKKLIIIFGPLLQIHHCCSEYSNGLEEWRNEFWIGHKLHMNDCEEEY